MNTADSIAQILGVVRALEFMHSLKVVHGDIKAVGRLVTVHTVSVVLITAQMNVLVDRDRNARLADFGLVSTLSNATIATAHFTSGGARGTGRWMAPELFKDAESPRSDLSDIYALAITVWEVNTYYSVRPETFACSTVRPDLHIAGAFLSDQQRLHSVVPHIGRRASTKTGRLRSHRLQ
jgi:serine/threonine protein kinase